MKRLKHSELCDQMDARGGYCTDEIGKCLREFYSVDGTPKKDIDLCLKESATRAAFERGEDLSLRFNSDQAKEAWLWWTANFSKNTQADPFPIEVDFATGIFRNARIPTRYGLLADVKSCIYVKKPNGSMVKAPRPTQLPKLPEFPDVEREINECRPTFKNEPETVREAIIAARRGQGDFRAALIENWEGKCAVTKCRNEAVLRASHIKAWKVSDNRERLDKFNGLLLSANLDALFDRGVISFAEDGAILISSRLSPTDAGLLGIHDKMKLAYVFPQSRPFLAHHRQQHGF